MLAADKLQLQSALKQQATALKEKEFNLHHSNMSECRNIRKSNERERCCVVSLFTRRELLPCMVIIINPIFVSVHSITNTATVGTIAAVLAGLDITMFIEFNPPSDPTWVRDK